MYTGRPYIKLFEDCSCTKEVDVDVFGNYVTTTQIISGISDIDFKRKIYVKNVGSHKAFNVKMIAMFSDSDIIAEINCETIKPKEVAELVLIIPIKKGQNMTKVLNYTLEYDCLPTSTINKLKVPCKATIYCETIATNLDKSFEHDKVFNDVDLLEDMNLDDIESPNKAIKTKVNINTIKPTTIHKDKIKLGNKYNNKVKG